MWRLGFGGVQTKQPSVEAEGVRVFCINATDLLPCRYFATEAQERRFCLYTKIRTILTFNSLLKCICYSQFLHLVSLVLITVLIFTVSDVSQ